MTSSTDTPRKRYGSVIGLRPEHAEEYKRLHADVWPGVLSAIHASNIRNYSIHLGSLAGALYLFSYYEYVGDDYAADMATMAADPTTQRWWEVCMPCQRPLDERDEGAWWMDLEEVFYDA